MGHPLAAYLDLVRTNYPFGIPRSVIKRSGLSRGSAPSLGAALSPGATPSWAAAIAPLEILVVVSDFGAGRSLEQFLATPAGELLSAALIKGLKLESKQYTVVDACELQGQQNKPRLIGTPGVILAFGEPAARAVAELISCDEQLHMSRVVSTLDLEIVVQDPQRKRELWRDIQGVRN